MIFINLSYPCLNRLVQMDVVKKKALGRSFPKPGKDKRITRTASFLKRQR